MAASSAVLTAQAENPTYVLGVPGAPTMYITSTAEDNPWLAKNNSYAAMSIAATTGGVSRVVAADAPRLELASAEAGFPFERAKPDYYLADVIEPPEGVDWTATYAAYLKRPEQERASFIFDDEGRRVFAAKGGTVIFTWALADGTSRRMTYTVSLSCSGRPRRIYWTDYPYNSPSINLTGKFVKFFGSDEILTIRYGSATNYTAGVSQIVTNKVVSGLYLDPSTSMLSAYGQLQGQVVMAYYDAGTFERLLHVQVVEVCRPQVNRLTGEIGRALKPDGRGYDTSGLRAQPTYVKPSDNRGDYYYQHQGSFSYSPKHGNVYPLRPTKDCPWKMEIYWMETDEMEVDWPFELDQYECDWPSDATVFVRGRGATAPGRPIYVPSEYTATLMSYQDPEGHARAVASDGTFSTLGEGYSLLKLVADDNVWFVPIHSILRTNTDYFTLESSEVRVGAELRLRGGSESGTAPGFSPQCNPSSPGYIYAAASDYVWNPNLYVAPQPDNMGSVSTTNATSSASSGDTNKYESVIYAVSALPTPASQWPKIEVWWNTTIQEDGMAKPLVIPTLPQVYSVRWPEPGETPQIVIASQLGSASESIFSHNMGLYLSETNSTAALPERKYFDANDGGTVMFWVKPGEYVPSGFSRNVVGFGFGAPREDLTVAFVDIYRRNGTTYLAFERYEDARHVDYADSVQLPGNAGWLHVAVCLSTTGTVVFVDGQSVYSGDGSTAGILSDVCSGAIGAMSVSTAFTRSGTTVGEVLFWNRALSADEIRAEMYKTHSGRENNLTGCFSFTDGKDLVVTGTDRRTFTEKVLGTVCTANGCLAEENGPPAIDKGMIDADADTVPRVYVQNDSGNVGYNPNEEHAIVRADSGGYVAWALRSDLNTDTSSAPGVLVEYVKGGRKAMQWFDVAVTNSVYPELAADCVAGKAFPGPHPIDFFDDPWCPENSWDEPVATAPAFRDRKNQLWARAAGTATMRMFYRMQDGFAFPSLPRTSWPSIGTAIPWLSLLGGSSYSTSVLSTQPHSWTWRVAWPEYVPEMEIGRTLTVAASGLPEVWNGKSVGVVWPATDAARDATAMLFDPTVAQASGFPKTTYATVADAIADLGIKQGAGGNATLRKGRWTFDGLPPSISKRFYLDTTADVTRCLKLEGEMEDNSAGVSLLHVNVLNDSERAVLSSLLDSTASTAGKKAWRTAIAALATKCVKPSPHGAVSANEDRIVYSPRDHYALFTMGATNYVTLIENDSTNTLMNVAQGDPISMHLVKVVPKYYTGRVVTREDPLNLLSQQLSIIYGEAFAGEPEQYVFEWKKCRPHANGTVPTDFDGEYTAKFEPTAGLTRFTIGHQGDTLENMVNTYYAVRYRAKDANSPAYAAMGDAWSEWTNPPALAEGWVQRVLNNVTPFAQRMRDLAEHEAETPVSMIVQAGKPYEGDVALNQDNLTSIGLIQLYETLLSKAESMSLQMGIDDPDANKQLQLAVARLADLYNTLGDEAYIDALNPTIGFGANFDNVEMTGFELDYGALSSTLFAFDNQVPTLLDEELALLRGRSGDNAPSTRISPYYNRLVWNFTKGITAGEVAYAVNYDISGNNKGIIDENDAADMYPQGHGDAYGHYLSALSGYYRLLRNPHFTWGEPAMGEMTVADAVVNVDYYDEAQFAKAAYNVAKVAAETVDRTARKAYRDNGGATGAGYLDDDATRNFGYGEWASRGGFGVLCNWAVGNALLPEEPKSGHYWRYRFTGGESSIGLGLEEDDALFLSQDGPWTVEFQVVPDNAADSAAGDGQTTLLTLDSTSTRLAFTRDSATGTVSASLYSLAPVTNSVQCAYYFYTNSVDWAEVDNEDCSIITLRVDTNEYACVFTGKGAPIAFPEGYNPATIAEFEENPPEFDGWGCMKQIMIREDDNGTVSEFPGLVTYSDDDIDYVVGTDTPEATVEIGVAPAGQNTLVALRRTEAGSATALLINQAGSVVGSATLTASFALDFASGSIVLGGDGYTGEIGEMRLWDGAARANADLHAKREYVSPVTEGLALYLRPLSDTAGTVVKILSDETDSAIRWAVLDGEWIVEHESGMNISFEDAGLARIDRSTVPELASLASVIPEIQKKVDQMDAGLNPLGLASGAIPFDITPIGEGDDAKTHFEQIRERAGTALANARKLLDKAQTMGSHIRMMQESQFSRENQLETLELEAKNQLIEYFGYPYEGDIGPGGTYPQGYDGPDLLHYAWMEPETCGLSAQEDVKSVTKSTYKFNVSKYVGGPGGGNVLMYNFYEKTGQMEFEFEKSATGIVLKPSNITGKRRAQGRIQEELGNMLAAYGNFKSAIAAWDTAIHLFDYENTTVWSKFGRDHALMLAQEAKYINETVSNWGSVADKQLVNSFDLALKMTDMLTELQDAAVPSVIGAGMTVITDPDSVVAAAALGPRSAFLMTQATSFLAAKNALETITGWDKFFDLAAESMEAANNYVDKYDDYYQRMLAAAEKVNDAAGEVRSAFIELQNAQCAVETVIAEAERVIETRTLARQQATDALTKTRYNEMFFRLARNNALSRYSAQFELAQKYAYLAAQAYDYETGLLSADRASGERFLARIVGARTLGEFDDDGDPIAASDAVKGDGGLAAVLAEMDANWLVLKPRLGINNPQPYATWFSLRHDLFRIYDEEDGDKAWKTELRKYVVKNLNDLPEFRHYCQPLAGSAEQKEPGLVIPFPSLISHGYNFFGQKLAGGDSALDSTYYATHISTAGVHFEGYDDGVLAKTPTAYLVPVGEDRMRAVGDRNVVLSWKVVDQTIPAPYAIGSTQLDDPDWTPLYDGATGGNDLGARIRKHPSFRAYYDDAGKDPNDDSLDCTRLVGRSAWNTKWLLIIPAGSLGADRAAALSAFVNGVDSNRDGKLDFAGVTDIKIGLKTYSTSGN